jgi:hypothetical protein
MDESCVDISLCLNAEPKVQNLCGIDADTV